MLNFAPKAELQIGLVDRLTSLAEALVSNLLDTTSVNSGNVCYSYLMYINILTFLRDFHTTSLSSSPGV